MQYLRTNSRPSRMHRINQPGLPQQALHVRYLRRYGCGGRAELTCVGVSGVGWGGARLGEGRTGIRQKSAMQRAGVVRLKGVGEDWDILFGGFGIWWSW